MDAFASDAFDVPDSTDWIGTPLAGLEQVEQALRCHVCKDFYNSPMITSCNHTFCSICIRRCLFVDGKCPLCRASDQESKLRGNWALREAVEAFVKARDAILRFARTPVAAAPEASQAPKSPKRKAADLEGPSEAKRPRMATRASKAKAVEANAAVMRDEIEASDEDDATDYQPEPEPEPAPEPDDGLVACPICWTRMKPWQVDRHIDRSCPGSPQPPNQQQQQQQQQPPPSTSAPPRGSLFPNAPPTPTKQTKPPERLPALAYGMLKDSALRKKLQELGLSTAGTRAMLENRHKEWVTLWNANCDSARPKKRSELLQDLEAWERTQGTRAPTNSRAAVLGAQIKDKDFDGAAWASKHESSFRDLIAKARSSRQKAAQPAGEAASGAAETGTSSAAAAPEGSGSGGEAPTVVPPAAEVVDLTAPPSSQPEPPDLPLGSGTFGAVASQVDGGLGDA
ncbi:hypothetical protein VTJ83DRAFT_4203 [Remersonia thermophila]|uniref:Postreplication repair E3 ubiquitin-protein ligase RAD18 n=1 Tax=Remersonia thermophila TaxID=72144 RepID=A0ABR4D9B3_9PEZI